ncbi:MAG: hypothetical protein HY875_09545 [Chloroflexi bacterium]|nr:hypothetical protein [Chloroflexota bacterium]
MPPSFDAIALTLLLAGWAIAGAIPWLALSVATRGNAGLAFLPIAMITGVIGALVVPIVGATGATGLVVSFPVAFFASAALLAARKLSLSVSHPADPVAAHGERRR